MNRQTTSLLNFVFNGFLAEAEEIPSSGASFHSTSSNQLVTQLVADKRGI